MMPYKKIKFLYDISVDGWVQAGGITDYKQALKMAKQIATDQQKPAKVYKYSEFSHMRWGQGRVIQPTKRMNPSNQITIPASRVIINPGKSISILAPKGTATRLMGTLKRIGKVTRRKVAGLGKGIRNFPKFEDHIEGTYSSYDDANKYARDLNSHGTTFGKWRQGSFKVKEMGGRYAVVGDSRNPGRRATNLVHRSIGYYSKSQAQEAKRRLEARGIGGGPYKITHNGQWWYVVGPKSNPGRRKGRRNPNYIVSWKSIHSNTIQRQTFTSLFDAQDFYKMMQYKGRKRLSIKKAK